MSEITDAERIEWLRATATPETIARCEHFLANWQTEGYTPEDWQTIAIGNVRTVGTMSTAVLVLLRAMQRGDQRRNRLSPAPHGGSPMTTSDREPITQCGPMICNFPPPWEFRWRQKWECSTCGTVYRRGRRVRRYRWWRNWIAPNGYWRLPLW